MFIVQVLTLLCCFAHSQVVYRRRASSYANDYVALEGQDTEREQHQKQALRMADYQKWNKLYNPMDDIYFHATRDQVPKRNLNMRQFKDMKQASRGGQLDFAEIRDRAVKREFESRQHPLYKREVHHGKW